MTLFLTLPLWRARGPRFLALLMVAWIALRAATWWPDPAELMPLLQPTARPQFPIVMTEPALPAEALPALAPIRPSVAYAPMLPTPLEVLTLRPDPVAALPSSATPRSLWASSDRHRWRYALLESLMPSSMRAAGATSPMLRDERFPPGTTSPSLPPIWAVPVDRRWSLSSYSYWRGGSGTGSSLAANRPAVLGGSQSAVRLDYVVAASPQLRAFARVTATPDRPRDVSLAVGMVVRPVRTVPVDLYVEQRLPLAGASRSRTLAYAAGGLDDDSLPFGFRLSAYAQGGVAGPEPFEAFVDGALAVQRPVLDRRNLRLSVGAMLAGAAQSGAARVDAGPRATLHLPRVGQGASVALDWRERLVGDARPGSGLALTLSTGF